MNGYILMATVSHCSLRALSCLLDILAGVNEDDTSDDGLAGDDASDDGLEHADEWDYSSLISDSDTD